MTSTTTDRASLPHRQLSQDEVFTKQDTYAVGDLVGIFSRGSGRVVRVSQVFPTRLEVQYTTETARKDALKLYEYYRSLSPRLIRDRAIANAAKNWAFGQSQLNGNTPNWRWGYDLTDSARAQYEAEREQGEDAYALEAGEQAFAAAEAKLAESNVHFEDFVAKHAHMTTKVVKLTEVYGLVSA